MEEKIVEIIEKYDEAGDVDECVNEVKNYLETRKVTDYKINTKHVYDSPGLDIYDIGVAWNDSEGLHLVTYGLWNY